MKYAAFTLPALLVSIPAAGAEMWQVGQLPRASALPTAACARRTYLVQPRCRQPWWRLLLPLPLLLPLLLWLRCLLCQWCFCSPKGG